MASLAGIGIQMYVSLNKALRVQVDVLPQVQVV